MEEMRLADRGGEGMQSIGIVDEVSRRRGDQSLSFLDHEFGIPDGLRDCSGRRFRKRSLPLFRYPSTTFFTLKNKQNSNLLKLWLWDILKHANVLVVQLPFMKSQAQKQTRPKTTPLIRTPTPTQQKAQARTSASQSPLPYENPTSKGDFIPRPAKPSKVRGWVSLMLEPGVDWVDWIFLFVYI